MKKSTDYVEILAKEKIKHKKYCEHCGHTISFYAFEKDRKVCNYCKRYNYRNEKIKFKYLLNKKINEIS